MIQNLTNENSLKKCIKKLRPWYNHSSKKTVIKKNGKSLMEKVSEHLAITVLEML